MPRRIEFVTLNDDVIDTRAINMTPEEFRSYAREVLKGEAKRIPHPLPHGSRRIVEAVRLMDDDRELCRVELGDVTT